MAACLKDKHNASKTCTQCCAVRKVSSVPRDLSWALEKVYVILDQAIFIAEKGGGEVEIPGAYSPVTPGPAAQQLVEKHIVELQIVYFVISFCIFL